MTTEEKQSERRKLWRQLIAEQKQCGKSIHAFCQERGVSEPSFYFWRQRLKKPEKAIRFALVESIAGSQGQREGIEVTLASGERLEIAPGADAATLRMVLAVLRETRA